MQKLLLIVLFAAHGFAQTPGTWKMNPAKSKHNDQYGFPRSLVIRYEAHAAGEIVTIWRVTQDGRSETDSYLLRFDGKDYPHPRRERFDCYRARKLDNGAIDILFMKEEKIVGREIRRLSADAAEVLIQYQFLNRNGEWL